MYNVSVTDRKYIIERSGLKSREKATLDKNTFVENIS
jgi:hypothetical protein